MKTNKLNLGQPSASQERSASRLGGNLTKRRGELGEAAFLAKAASMGIGVAKPWGDSERYDFIIDVGGRLLKVQIKSAHCVSAARSGGYTSAPNLGRRFPTTPMKLICSWPTLCRWTFGTSSLR